MSRENEMTENDRELFLRAWEKYCATGFSDVRCDRCNEIIKFERVTDSVTVHSCKCGKFNGEMRGL